VRRRSRTGLRTRNRSSCRPLPWNIETLRKTSVLSPASCAPADAPIPPARLRALSKRHLGIATAFSLHDRRVGNLRPTKAKLIGNRGRRSTTQLVLRMKNRKPKPASNTSPTRQNCSDRRAGFKTRADASSSTNERNTGWSCSSRRQNVSTRIAKRVKQSGQKRGPVQPLRRRRIGQSQRLARYEVRTIKRQQTARVG